ncbi:hypothetical protein PIB30_104828 [Stylosanthes scabra]|uniref:Uncharacterized protein n=1 Tax=Stylosanthes scabra TaxID=79078 RepID=A0ABU6QZ62_9FABA|nr:hypothetical protein [Stylosanthes scabra]
MEDLSMFQRPRTVALEDENPLGISGVYGDKSDISIHGLAPFYQILFISLINHHSPTIATLVFLTTKIVLCVNSLGDDPSLVLGNTILILLRRLGRSTCQNGAVAGELNMHAGSNPNPDLLDLDLELERTLRRARHVRRRIKFENSLYSQTENLATDEISVDSSLSDSESENFFSPTHAGTLNMAEPPRITLRQMGGVMRVHLGLFLASNPL